MLGNLLTAAAVCVAPTAGATGPEKLEGQFQLGGRLDHKGSPGPGKSHLYISVTAGAAKRLYDSLAGAPREDACTGYRIKSEGNVGCYEISPNQTYFCSFSVNLQRGAVEAGVGGCI